MSYSADTEILTRRGWLTFDQVTLADEVATRNPENRAFEWQAPLACRQRAHQGPIWSFRSKAVDFCVTPGHEMLINPDRKPVAASRPGWQSRDRLVLADDIRERLRRVGYRADMGIPAMSAWGAPDLDMFRLEPGEREIRGGWRQGKPLVLSGDDFAAFMGMYLAEGCVTDLSRYKGVRGTPRIIFISQRDFSKGFPEYKALLERILGREVQPRQARGFGFLRQALSDYLVQFGKAHEKWLPSEVLDMSQRQLRILWHFYMLGDGSKRPHNGREGIVTTSWRMADGLQEVAQKIGSSASVRTWQPRATARWKDGHSTPPDRARLIYRVVLRTSRVHRITAADLVDYGGTVHDISVPNQAVYVRRDRKPGWGSALIRGAA